MYRLLRLFNNSQSALTPPLLLFRKRSRTSEQRLFAPFPLRAKTAPNAAVLPFNINACALMLVRRCNNSGIPARLQALSRRLAVATNFLRAAGVSRHKPNNLKYLFHNPFTSERVALVPIFYSAFSVAALNPISVLAVSYPHIIGSHNQTLYAKSLDALSHPCYIIINQYHPAGTGGDTDEETLHIVTCMSTSVHRLHARELSSCIQHVNQPLIPRLGPP